MAKDQRNVEAITPMEEDFAKWYTDICLKAELVDYASVKGFLILRPYGYAIWENIQKLFDARFKETGHENVYMPMFIPESLMTSWSWFFRSLIHPYLGMKDLISFLRSWIP